MSTQTTDPTIATRTQIPPKALLEAASRLVDVLTAITPVPHHPTLRSHLHQATLALRQALYSGYSLVEVLDRVIEITAPDATPSFEPPPPPLWSPLLALSFEAFSQERVALQVDIPKLAMTVWLASAPDIEGRGREGAELSQAREGHPLDGRGSRPARAPHPREDDRRPRRAPGREGDGLVRAESRERLMVYLVTSDFDDSVLLALDLHEEVDPAGRRYLTWFDSAALAPSRSTTSSTTRQTRRSTSSRRAPSATPSSR